MFNSDFYPTPSDVIDHMLFGISLNGKNVLEPSAGKGDIVDYLINAGANVSACETNIDLQKIVASKCKILESDFLKVTADVISHIQLIVMNPPFSADEKHILHAFEIAPAGCKIIALCNYETLNNRYSSLRLRLSNLVKDYGRSENLGDCFSNAERKTGINIGLVFLQKPGATYESEFEGFFLDEEPEEAQYNGMMPYNFVRDVVNRYVAAIKLYDEQAEMTAKMNGLLKGFYSSDMAFKSVDKQGYPVTRNDFKKDLQKQAWHFIINKFNLNKHATKGLKEDINKFVEQQTQVPFTMRNIYRMIEIIIGTSGQRMDKALLEVFDKLTQRYHENRYNLEGWKTNSHYLVNQKFIIEWICGRSYGGGLELNYNGNAEIIEDLAKALCFLTGVNYDDFHCLEQFTRYRFKLLNTDGSYRKRDTNGYPAIYHHIEDANRAKDALYKSGVNVTIEDSKPQFGEWFSWAFFECKGFKKGTMHFKFKDVDVWGKFNQRVAELKGFPLPENIKRKAA